jgi:hypothetical protein
VDAEAHESDAEAAGVHHLHHAVDAFAVPGGVGRRLAGDPVLRPGQEGLCPLEGDLARRHADSSELRLQPLDLEPVGPAVG